MPLRKRRQTTRPRTGRPSRDRVDHGIGEMLLRLMEEKADDALSLSEVLERICRSMTELLPVDRCALHLWSGRRGSLIPVAENGTPARLRSRLASIGYPSVVEWGLAAGDAVVIHRRDAKARDVARWLLGAELYALAAIPLRGRGGRVGALILGRHSSPAFGHDVLAVAQGAARQMGPLIENARLLRKIRKAAAFRAGVAELAAALNAWNDLAVIARLVCKRGAELFGVSNAVLFRRYEEGLRTIGATGPRARDAFGLTLSVDDERDPVVCAFRQARPVFVNEVDPALEESPPFARRLGCRSLLAVPLVGVAGTDGCIVYGDADNRYAFGESLADEGAQLAAIATGAIERAHSAQVEQARRAAELHAAELDRQAAELTAARNAALAAAEAKAGFLANMSHEIRTPMTAILGYLNLVSRPDIGEEARQRHLATIRRNGEHLLRILNDILDLSKVEAGKMTVERVACSTTDLIGEVVSLMQPRALEKGLSFEIECATPIPETIYVDPTRLRQVLLNLISNGIKFTESGGIRLRLSLRTAADATRHHLCFDVIDTGIGLSSEAMAALFTPFSQGDTSMTRRFGGTGLGLAISARLAHLLGGAISVQSSPGGGSTFSLSVEVGPLDGVAMRSELRPATAPTRRPASLDLGPSVQARVLLAEDTPDNQQLFAFHLEHAGVDLEIVGDGNAACERALAAAAAGAPFDVILMDMQMPVLDGEQATRRLRHAGYVGPIVALTAHALQSERDRCLQAGCNGFASKPIEPDELVGIVRRFARPCEGARVGSSPASALTRSAEFAALRDRFVAGLPNRAAAMERDLATGDLKGVARQAHQLKGTSGGYGFAPISEAAGRLEESLGAGLALDAIRRQVCEVAELCRQARATTASGETAAAEQQ